MALSQRVVGLTSEVPSGETECPGERRAGLQRAAATQLTGDRAANLAMAGGCITWCAHTEFGQRDEPDVEALMANVSLAAPEHASVEPDEVDAIYVGVLNGGFLRQVFEGSLAARVGISDPGGPLPVNRPGGLKAKGHPVGATGVSQHVMVAPRSAAQLEAGRGRGPGRLDDVAERPLRERECGRGGGSVRISRDSAS
jgi:hypothetical protein